MWNLLPQPEYVACFYRWSLNNAWGSFYPLSISCPETCMFIRSHSRQLCDMPNKRRVLDTHSTLSLKPTRRVSLYNKARGLDMFRAYNQTSWPTVLAPGADARWEVTNSRGSEGSMMSMDKVWMGMDGSWAEEQEDPRHAWVVFTDSTDVVEITFYKEIITLRHRLLDDNWQVKLNMSSNGNGYQVPLCLGIKWIDKILDGAIKTLPRDNYHREMCDNDDVN